MRVIRASEIGSFLYCRRAWWYQLQGIESQNQSDLATGTEYHHQHGRNVFLARLFRLFGALLLLVALVLLAVGLTLLWVH